MDFNQEVWKDIEGYNGAYQISNMGRLWSTYKQRYLSGNIKSTGYLSVTLMQPNGKQVTERIHRLVALHFCDKPEGCTVVNHLNMNKLDNKADNLEWTTVSGNTKHAFDNSFVFKENQYTAALKGAAKSSKRIDAFIDNNFIGTFESKKACAETLGVSEKTIYNRLNSNFNARSGYDFRLHESGVMPCLKY